jgi:GT2 family glycosyltransferase
MNDYPEVAVVILNWNGRRHLETYLPSVMATIHNSWRLVVIDNASTDDSVEFLRQNYADKLEIVILQENFGYAGGYNQGLKQIPAKFYVLLNSDIEVTPNWLDRPMELLKIKNIAAVQPKILSWKERDKFEYAGAAGGYIDRWGYPFCAGRLFQDLETDLGQYDYEKDVFWVSGACMFVRTDAFWKVGGLDEDYFAHMEEIDLCWRLHNAGYRLIQTHLSTVYHLGGGSLAYGNPRKTFLNFRNSLITVQKNLPLFSAILVILVRLILDLPAALLFLARGSSADFRAVANAHFAFYRMQKNIRSKRKLIQVKKGRHHIKTIYSGSVVLDYFLKGKKRLPGFVSTNHARDLS